MKVALVGPYPVDLSDWDAVDAAFADILRQWDRIDVLVNAAGAKPEGAIEAATRPAAQSALEVNYLGALACCRAVLPGMRRRGSGHILNISSVLGKRATPQRGLYAASKAALNALTDALRLEVADTGVHVTLVCPGRLADGATARQPLAQSVVTSADRILNCLDRPRRELILTLAARALVWGGALAPGWLDRMLLWWRYRERHLDEPRSVDRTTWPEEAR